MTIVDKIKNLGWEVEIYKKQNSCIIKASKERRYRIWWMPPYTATLEFTKPDKTYIQDKMQSLFANIQHLEKQRAEEENIYKNIKKIIEEVI